MEFLGRGPQFFKAGGKRHVKNTRKPNDSELSYNCLMGFSQGKASYATPVGYHVICSRCLAEAFYESRFWLHV